MIALIIITAAGIVASPFVIVYNYKKDKRQEKKRQEKKISIENEMKLVDREMKIIERQHKIIQFELQLSEIESELMKE